MKKIILSLIIVTLSVTLSAQSFRGGLMAGFAASQVDGDMYAGYNRAGIIAGAFVNRKISEKFLWQMEIKYIQKGSYKNANPDVGDYGIYSLRLNYVEIPFLIQYRNKHNFSFEVGAAAGYLAKYKEADQVGELPYDPTRPDFHKFELSSQLGVYFHFNDNFRICARYSYSILPVRPHASGAVYLSNRGQYNNVLQLSLYYSFSKKDG